MKNFIRLPSTTDRSLKAWSAADEHILRHITESDYSQDGVSIFHDRFGYLTCNLSIHNPVTITYLDSQKESIIRNAAANNLSIHNANLITVLDDIHSKGNIAVMKIPKSLDLFRLYLIKILDALPSDVAVIAGFMTRHFTKAMLTIAAEYFEVVKQSTAWKKSRLLLLSSPKKNNNTTSEILNSIIYKEYEYKQYLGVFSSNHIDYATQFLLDNLKIRDSEKTFLDIGCGNGVIGKYLLDKRSWNEAILMDDSILASASTEINISEHTLATTISRYHLESFEDGQFDLVITNPPFHFEYEVDPSIAIQMMQDTHKILAPNGRIVVVANRHLNYKSQLLKWYNEIAIINENDKFIIYEAFK